MTGGRARRLGDQLVALGRVRVPLTGVLNAWAAAVPELAGRSENLPALAEGLAELADEGLVELPASRSWDRTTRPPLPRFVTVPSARRPRRPATWRTHPWQRPLAWAASLGTVGDRHFDALIAVDEWLRRTGGEATPVPARMRSAEIFGDEKLLDDLANSSLFADGRLSYDLLRAIRYPPPLTIRHVGPGSDVLIVENADSFWACVQLLGSGRIGRVAWGAGGGAVMSIAALAWEPQPVRQIFYWGDLDPEGIRIAGDVDRMAAKVPLPGVEPAVPLYVAMTFITPQAEGTRNWDRVSGAWLGRDLWAAIEPIRKAGGRVAQERVPWEHLAQAVARLDRF